MGKKIALAAVFVVMFGILLALVPVEQRRMYYEKYGKLAVDAETDERAAFIIENYDKYPPEMLVSNKIDHKDLSDDYDFLYNYFAHKDDHQTMSFTAEELNSELPPRLYMGDFRWCYEDIGGAFIAKKGCGAVTLSMAYIYLTHSGDVDPVTAARAIEECGAWSEWSGFDTNYISEVCGALGMQSKNYFFPELDADESAEQIMKDILDSGHACFLSLTGGLFGGHAVLAVAYTDEGFILNDPASEERSDMVWSFDELKTQIYGIYDLSVNQ